MEKENRSENMRVTSVLKKVVFSLILIVMAFLTMELVLNLAYLAVKFQRFPYSSYERDIFRIAGGGGGVRLGEKRAELTFHADEEDHPIYGQEVIHPYFGFVKDPARLVNVSKWGFPGEDDDPFYVDDEDTLVIAIYGGSFAGGVARWGRRALQSELEKRGIRARVLNFAMGGYKQPQQVSTLVWLLSEGANIDFVVNIDGFNEVALPTAENIPRDVYPFYPRAWAQRMLRLHNRTELRLIGQGVLLADQRQVWAERFRDTWLPRSIMMNLIWKARDRRIESGIEAINNELLEEGKPSSGSEFIRTGPDYRIPEDELYERIASHWAACSRLMHQLSRSNGMRYIHLLQPNQYFGGKVLTPEEKSRAWRENHRYRPGVVNGYPLLVKNGRELRSEGIDFHDITYIYKDVKETIYVDDCCHPNRKGYEIVAKYVASAIIANMRKP